MKTTKKLLAVLLSVVMLLGILPLSVLAEETQTVEQGIWVAGTKVSDGTSNTVTYWVNDGNGGITQEGATEKKYNVKVQYSNITLKNANLSKLYEYYSEEATDYQGYTLKEAAVIYSNIYSLNLVLEGKNNTITAKVDDTQTVRYQSVAGICCFNEKVTMGNYNNPQYSYNGTIELRGKGKLDLNVSKGNKVYDDYYKAKEVCKGIYFYTLNIRDNSKITVSDSDVAFFCGRVYGIGNTRAGSMHIYNGTIEAKCNYMVFNTQPYNKYIRDPKIVVSGDKSGETTEKYEESLGSLSGLNYKYVKITARSAVSAFFLNTFEDVAEYLVPQYVFFLLEVLMQFPLAFRALLNWIIELILGLL